MQFKPLSKSMFLSNIISLLLRSKIIRRKLLLLAEKRSKEYMFNVRDVKEPARATEENYILLRNLFRTIAKNYERGYISHKYVKNLIRVLAGAGKPHKEQVQEFVNRYGFRPPFFLLLSPTQACNLNCPGCYAACDKEHKTTMDYDTVIRILREKKESWKSNFTVISGGEPFMYRSQGKTIFDVFAEFPETFFLVYTNGTMITEKVAQRLANLGNVTVAISVEGYEKETDERRGPRTYEKILKAFENLRKAGVMFGLSITVTSKNADMFIHHFDEFNQFYFNQQGASYAWMFQYMPIGRDHNTFDLLPTPQQRRILFDKTWKQVKEKGYMIADFWNSGHVTGGCLAAGRTGGFLYIDWNGNVMPCVFNPFYYNNIHEVYANDGHIDDVLFSPLMKGIRKWQKEYYYNDKEPNEKGSVFTPCPLKDHYNHTYNEVLTKSNVKFSNPEADAAYHSPIYYKNMVKYGEDSRKLFDPLWDEYLTSGPTTDIGIEMKR